jgi:tRNA threonylcarbamoyladenosine biosynthesis protein TsaE
VGESRDEQAMRQETYTFAITSQSIEQTRSLGTQLGLLLLAGDLILLEGNLGAGKTTFTQGLAQGLNITDVVNSPTFTLLKEYPLSFVPGVTKSVLAQPEALYHFDFYRLDDPEEVLDLGFEDYFYGSGVCIIEWAEKAGGIWPAERLDIRLSMVDETQRHLLFVATGKRYCELLRQFQKNTYATTSS